MWSLPHKSRGLSHFDLVAPSYDGFRKSFAALHASRLGLELAYKPSYPISCNALRLLNMPPISVTRFLKSLHSKP